MVPTRFLASTAEPFPFNARAQGFFAELPSRHFFKGWYAVTNDGGCVFSQSKVDNLFQGLGLAALPPYE